jgi:hypothetical protein
MFGPRLHDGGYLMLDIALTRDSPPGPLLNLTEPLFYTVELSRQADGNFFIEVTATSVDEEGPSLVNEELARDRVATIDDALALIRANVRIA